MWKIILDWDDTILPTTVLKNKVGTINITTGPVDIIVRNSLRHHTAVAIAFLTIALQSGDVVIITAADMDWVLLTCDRWLPALLPIVQGMKIIYARSYGASYCNDPTKWKEAAFYYELVHNGKLMYRGAISIGDSNYEREALIRVTKDLCLGKSIKLLYSPSINEITRQLELICLWLSPLVRAECDLDLCVKIEYLE